MKYVRSILMDLDIGFRVDFSKGVSSDMRPSFDNQDPLSKFRGGSLCDHRPVKPRADDDEGSCPVEWCSSGFVHHGVRLGRIDQMATAGNPTTGSSLKLAMVSSVM